MFELESQGRKDIQAESVVHKSLHFKQETSAGTEAGDENTCPPGVLCFESALQGRALSAVVRFLPLKCRV